MARKKSPRLYEKINALSVAEVKMLDDKSLSRAMSASTLVANNIIRSAIKNNRMSSAVYMRDGRLFSSKGAKSKAEKISYLFTVAAFINSEKMSYVTEAQQMKDALEAEWDDMDEATQSYIFKNMRKYLTTKEAINFYNQLGSDKEDPNSFLNVFRKYANLSFAEIDAKMREIADRKTEMEYLPYDWEDESDLPEGW